MANNSMGQGANMPTIGTINQGTIQYVNNPIQSPQLQATSIQGSPSQHSPMGTQSQVGAKANQSGAGDQTTQVYIFHTFLLRLYQPTLWYFSGVMILFPVF